MSLLKIAQLGEPVLHRSALPVSERELASPAFQQLIDDMIDTMRDAHGVGIAAPQVFQSRRVFLVEVVGPNPRYPDQPDVPLTVVVNPEIVDHAPEQAEDWEGCLSIPELRGRVPRWTSVRLVGQGRDGAPLDLTASGFFARVIQHELDHLNGMVFLDRMAIPSIRSHLAQDRRPETT